MAKSINRAVRVGYDVVNISGTVVKVIEYDSSGNIRRAEGLTVPASLAGFAKGGQFVKTDASSGTKAIYENQGTTSSSSFDLMGSAGPAEVIATDGASFLDDAGNEELTWGVTGSAINNFKMANAATGNNPVLSAVGDDAAVGIGITVKGSGAVVVTAATGGLDINGTTAVVGVLDEDAMGSDSDTNLATQQSIKAYVDAQVASSDSLQEAYDVGNTITVADTINTSLVFTQNDTTNNPDAVQINNAGTGDELQLTSTNGGATGAKLAIVHTGGSQLSGDITGRILFTGQDDASAAEDYAQIDCIAGDVTAANPDGTLIFYVNSAGTLTQRMQMDGDTINGVFVGDGVSEGALHSQGSQDLNLGTGSGTGGAILLGDGAASGITLTPDTTGDVTVESTDGGAVGAQLILNHAGGSQTAADVAGRITFQGEDDAVAAEDYARIDVVVVDAAAANPDGRMSFYTDVAGTLAEQLRLDDSFAGIQVGGSGVAGTVASNGAANLNLQTGSGTGGVIQLVDGANGEVGIAPAGEGAVFIIGSDPGARGAQLILAHEGGSQAASDVCGRITFEGEDDAAATEEYGRIDCVVTDATAANPDADLIFYANVAGSLTEHLRLTHGGIGITGTEVFATITTSTGAGAVGITGRIHEITTTGTGDALTLANGSAGQKLTILYVAEAAGGDTAVLTPTTLAGGSTITFNALGDSAELTYSSTGGWYMHGGTAAIA